MLPLPVIAIFDVGKTNKKLFLFDEHYRIVFESSRQFEEASDEDGDPCENLDALTTWGKEALHELLSEGRFIIKAVNFSAYGASFVHIDEKGKPVTPLYNYLKPYPAELKKRFYDDHGGELAVSMATASPVLGHLNSGMQLYWLKNTRPEIFNKIKYSLHLPQYLSYLFTAKSYSDITSIGCHTNLWDFSKNKYHEWVTTEGVYSKLAPIYSSSEVLDAVALAQPGIKAGIGLHDSSAALIPYLACFTEPFILISTGTWCITLNPFNKHPLTEEELRQDCLSYMSYRGNPVKASRLFAGNEHEIETKRLAKHFNSSPDQYKSVEYDIRIIATLSKDKPGTPAIKFADRDLKEYKNYEIAYHRLILDIMWQQLASTKLVIQDNDVKRIFVDGGFSNNSIYMHLLAEAFPDMEVYAASVAQATAVGAALAIHNHWNPKPLPGDLIDLKFYTKPTI